MERAAVAVELGTAFLTVLPSMRGMSGKLAAEMQKEGAAAQKSFSAGMSRGNVVTAGAKKVTSAVGGVLKTGLAATGLSVGAVLGKALVGGFNRLKDVENAQAKLSGLGHSAKSVQKIMDDALASVKGTAFGLDEAASVAASTVAAGVKPGKDLERTLRLVADAATIGGASMGEMGSIFNKVAASNKVQGEVIAQLNDRGIPIIQLLSKELGKSAEETVKLASEGKINFDTFRNAMESGLGGAALKSGETMQGSFKNMGAALSRLGQNLL